MGKEQDRQAGEKGDQGLKVCKFREGNFQALHSSPDLPSRTSRARAAERLQGCTSPAMRVPTTSVVPSPQSPSLCLLLHLGPPRLPEQPLPTSPSLLGLL